MDEVKEQKTESKALFAHMARLVPQFVGPKGILTILDWAAGCYPGWV